MKHTINWLAAAAIAFALAATWDQPTEIQSIQDIADEVEHLSGGAK